MSELKLALFGKTKGLVGQIDEFLDTVSEAGMVFEEGVTSYIENGVDGYCEEKVMQIRELKTRGSDLCRTVDRSLYTEMLVPEARGDVLALLGDLAQLLDEFKDSFVDLSIERPDFPDGLKADFRALAVTVVKSVEHTVHASRAFFRDFLAVRDHIHKIGFYEDEADTIALRLKTSIFAADLPLARKLHLAAWVKVVDDVADEAEDVGDRLSIYAIKRTL